MEATMTGGAAAFYTVSAVVSPTVVQVTRPSAFSGSGASGTIRRGGSYLDYKINSLITAGLGDVGDLMVVTAAWRHPLVLPDPTGATEPELVDGSGWTILDTAFVDSGASRWFLRVLTKVAEASDASSTFRIHLPRNLTALKGAERHAIRGARDFAGTVVLKSRAVGGTTPYVPPFPNATTPSLVLGVVTTYGQYSGGPGASLTSPDGNGWYGVGNNGFFPLLVKEQAPPFADAPAVVLGTPDVVYLSIAWGVATIPDRRRGISLQTITIGRGQ